MVHLVYVIYRYTSCTRSEINNGEKLERDRILQREIDPAEISVKASEFTREKREKRETRPLFNRHRSNVQFFSMAREIFINHAETIKFDRRGYDTVNNV